MNFQSATVQVMDAVDASGGTLAAESRGPELLNALQWQGLRRILQVKSGRQSAFLPTPEGGWGHPVGSGKSPCPDYRHHGDDTKL
eukprot:s285_g22.t1